MYFHKVGSYYGYKFNGVITLINGKTYRTWVTVVITPYITGWGHFSWDFFEFSSQWVNGLCLGFPDDLLITARTRNKDLDVLFG